MIIIPAIDLYEGKAVRLFKGDYARMTVYSEDPVETALTFKNCGAAQIHLVDLEGARNGTTPNDRVITAIKEKTGLFCEIGGGIRSMEVIRHYLDAGLDRVILGTAAVKDRKLVREAVDLYGEKIAVGVDIRDGYVSVSGWTEDSRLEADTFIREMQETGVRTIICTDISRDGAMKGTNRELYRHLTEEFDLQIIASGGVSTMEDVVSLAGMDLYGAIIGKAYYSGAIDLKEAIEAAL